MHSVPLKPSRGFTEAARVAALATKRAKMNEPDDFGEPKVFVVKAGARTFTWELRRFGGVVIQSGFEGFDSQTAARAAGREALATLCSMPGLPTFKRQNVAKEAAVE